MKLDETVKEIGLKINAKDTKIETYKTQRDGSEIFNPQTYSFIFTSENKSRMREYGHLLSVTRIRPATP